MFVSEVSSFDTISSIASSLESSGAADSGEAAAPVAETPAADTSASDAAPVAEASEAGADASEVAEQPTGEGDDDESQLRGSMPLRRHKAVLTRQRNEAKAALDKALADAKAQHEAQLARYKPFDSYLQQPTFLEEVAMLQAMKQSPERAAEVLLSNPALAPIIEARLRERLAPKTTAKPGADDPKPQPDLQYQDEKGEVTRLYSDAQQEKLLEWQQRQFERKLDERFAPIEQTEKQRAEAAKQQAAMEKAWQGALKRQGEKLERARKSYVKYTEHEGDIKAFLNQPGNESMTLDEGYIAVVVPKLIADRDAMRASLLEELNAKPQAAAAVTKPGPSAIPAAGAKPQDSESIIANIAAQLERKSAA